MAIVACPPPAPAYDNCAGAVALELGTPVSGYTTTRSIVANPGVCGSFASGINYRTAWYTLVGTGNTMTVGTDSVLTTHDTLIGVYCLSNGCGTQTCIGGDDDSGAGNTSLFSFCSDQNAVYAVVVGGFGGSTGNFEVLATDSGVPCTTAISCAPKGACCLPATSSCAQLTSVACQEQGGTYSGNGTTCATFSYGTPNSSADTFPIAIPDFVTPTPGSAQSTVVVSSAGVNVEQLKVCVGLSHTFPGDLIGTLSNSTRSARLFSRQGGSADVLGTYCFASDGNILFAGGAPTGVYSSLDSLGVFAGDPADDTWTLTVTDNAGVDVGSISSFDISFGTAASNCNFCPPCAADYNQDGGVDGTDISAFFPDWENSASCADVNLDGGIDIGDIDAFFAGWENGGC